MAQRRITRHATRLSAAHEGALDPMFHVEQRVVTPEGLTGRILLVTESFSPGNTEYQVVLDSGLGGGTYLGSQLRPVPDDLRALPQSSNLPAGLAALDAEAAEIHVASEDYPEMGTVLHDRPDPAHQITMIGAAVVTDHIDDHGDAPDHGLTPRAADPEGYDEQSTEGQPDPTWDEDPYRQKSKDAPSPSAGNLGPDGTGGVPDGMGPGDAGIPVAMALHHEARVPWTDKERTELHNWQVVPTVTWGDWVSRSDFTNRNPVAGSPPEPEFEDEAEPMEHAAALHGDPLISHMLDYHGTSPDEVRDEQELSDLHDAHHREGVDFNIQNWAHPHMHEDHLRPLSTEEHGEPRFAPQDVSHEYHILPSDVALPEQHADAGTRRPDLMPMHTLSSCLDPRTAASRKIADSVYGQLAKDYPHHAISWVHDVPWQGPGTTALHDIDWDDRDQWAAYNQPERVAKVQKKANKKLDRGEDPKPAVLMRPAGDRRSRIADGHHRALGALLDGRPLHGFTAQVPDADGPWDTMHDQQFTQAQGGDSNAAERGPDGSPEDREQLHRDVEGRVATLPRSSEGEDDGLDDSLDFAAEGDDEQDGQPGQDEAGSGQDPAGQPGQPGAPQITRGPPMTQGSGDGRRERQKGLILQTPQDAQAEAEKKAQLEELGDDDGDGNDGPPSKKEKRAALRMFREAARSPSFGFEFTASWRDVVAKAKRLRTAGRVRITAVAAGYVIGEVGGDHDVYESSVQRRPGHPNSILAFACGCPWATFHQDKSYPGRLNGRPCSHAYAVHLESLSRRMNGRPMTADPEIPGWLTHDVVVKSVSPWGAGGWAQTWTAPSTAQPFYASLRLPELTPAHEAARLLLDGGTSPAAVETLMTLAGMASSDKMMARHLETAHGWPASYLDGLREGDEPLDYFHDRSHAGGSANKIPHRHDQEAGAPGPLRLVQADQANAPWGSDNTAPHSPTKPYGATEPPQKDMDPGSYGFLAGPDPENWGEIRDDSAVQMPLGNEAMLRTADETRSLLVPTAPSPLPPDLNYPDVSDFHERQESFPYAGQANAGGPSTSITPRDPQGIRMEEALRRAFTEVAAWDTGDPGVQPVPSLPRKGNEPADEPDHPASCDCTSCEYSRYHAKHRLPVWATASPSDTEAPQQMGGLGAELHDEPEPALDPDGLTAGDVPAGGGDSGSGSDAPSAMGTASMGEWGASRRASIRARLSSDFHDSTPGGYALDADTTGGGPGMSQHDEDSLGWDEPSIQTVGEAQWSGAGSDSDEVAVPAGQPQGQTIDGGGLDTMASASEAAIVAQFQASAAARQLGGSSKGPGAAPDGSIAAAARHFLKTGKVLSDEEAGELIAEGRGTRARNLDLLDLEGTHYEAEDEAMKRRGLSLDNFDDDLVLI